MAGQAAAVRAMIADIVRETQAVPADAMRELAPHLGRAQLELEEQLAEWLASGPDAGERFTAHHLRKLIVQLRAVNGSLEDVGDAMGGALVRGNKAAAMMSTENLSREIARLGKIFDGDGMAVDRIGLSTAAKLVRKNSWLLERFSKASGRFAPGAIARIRAHITVAAIKQETMGQMVARIVGLTPKARVAGGAEKTPEVAADMARGLMRGPWAEAERIVRTELAEAYNAHHLDGIDEFAATQEPGAVLKRWDASADRRCQLCHALDGKKVAPGEEFPGGFQQPPRHPYCRCCVIPWMAHWPEIKPLPAVHSATQRRFAVAGPVVTRGGTAVETRRALRSRALNTSAG